MKTRLRLLILLGGLMLLAALFWARGSRPGARSLLNITRVANPTNNSAGGVTFRLTNKGEHSLFLSEVFIEVKTSAGWQQSKRLTPSDPRTMGAGASKDILVQAPDGTVPWRLRVVYGDEVRYPSLFLLKAEVAIGSRSWGPFSRLRPGDTWTGSNSLTSAEVAN